MADEPKREMIPFRAMRCFSVAELIRDLSQCNPESEVWVEVDDEESPRRKLCFIAPAQKVEGQTVVMLCGDKGPLHVVYAKGIHTN